MKRLDATLEGLACLRYPVWELINKAAERRGISISELSRSLGDSTGQGFHHLWRGGAETKTAALLLWLFLDSHDLIGFDPSEFVGGRLYLAGLKPLVGMLPSDFVE